VIEINGFTLIELLDVIAMLAIPGRTPVAGFIDVERKPTGGLQEPHPTNRDFPIRCYANDYKDTPNLWGIRDNNEDSYNLDFQQTVGVFISNSERWKG
jgi:prepilin-type N-terminal cleavage/methylation domain-containing protein